MGAALPPGDPLVTRRGLWLLALLVLGGCAPEAARDADLLEPGSLTPHLSVAPDGRVVLSYLVDGEDAATLRFVTSTASGWSEARTVAASHGEEWFVNWADFPSVVDIRDDLMAAHWLVKSAEDTFAYDIRMALSLDGGGTWGETFTLHDDGTHTEHGFVSLYPVARGLGALWLDGRDFFLQGPENGATQLRSAVVGPDGQVTRRSQVDPRICDCCQTDVTVAASGPVAVYRDRSSDEIRDIYVTRMTGNTWETGRPVASDNWHIAGCPVNGPAIDAAGSRVAVAWYTAHPDPRVQVAFSADSAETFGPPIRLDTDQPLGRVDVVLMGDSAVVSWLDANPGRILARRVTPGGDLSPVVQVALTSPQRNAGFPRMIRHGKALLFAWTDVEADAVRTRTLTAPEL